MSTEPTFPTPHASAWLSHPDPEGDGVNLAEAWAWRCADTMPDSAQSRRDAEADAEALRRVARSVYRGFAYNNSDIGLADSLGDGDFIRRGCPGIYIGGTWTEVAAKHAFRACPGLRGEHA